MNDQLDREFRDTLGNARVLRDLALAQMTTFRVGGRADWYVEVRGADEIRRVLAIARRAGLPVSMLGGGSNVLVADSGVEGGAYAVRRTAGGDAWAALQDAPVPGKPAVSLGMPSVGVPAPLPDAPGCG